MRGRAIPASAQRFAGSRTPRSAGVECAEDGIDCAGNHHLHVYIGAPLESDPKRAVEVDGYGVYGQTSSGCYTNIATNTYYPRLFAPFLPEFYDTTFTNFAADPYYYDVMSFLPQTLSAYSKSGVTDVAGSYQYSTVGGYAVKVGDDGTGLSDGVLAQAHSGAAR